ncbi:MAG: glycosyltransferase family 2 protein [Desulfobacterales bacterium]
MKTSIIITTYNRPELLEKVLEALRFQTKPADEVIVADDGSKADTRDLVDRFMNFFPGKLLHVWHEDRGFRAAEIRNKAIAGSSGDYIVSLDGDCIPERHFVEDHMLLAEPGCFFQGKRVLVSKRLSGSFCRDTANSRRMLAKAIFTGDISNIHHIIRLPFFPSRHSTRMSGIKSCNMGFFREDIVAVNGFNQDFVGWGREDSELVARFYKFGLKRKEHPFLAICFHLWHEENDRKELVLNDELLRKAVQSNDYICSNGLVQK